MLLDAERYDGAIYLCGYAIELALKAKICETLNWVGYPATNREFQNYQTFRTHDLDVLLTLSGSAAAIKTALPAEWSAVANWEPEVRYKDIGSATEQAVVEMLESIRTLLEAL